MLNVHSGFGATHTHKKKNEQAIRLVFKRIKVNRGTLHLLSAQHHVHSLAVLDNQEQAITGVLEIIIVKSVHKAVTPEEGRTLLKYTSIILKKQTVSWS